MPLEAQACGSPVIAFGEGGAKETVLGDVGPGQTGLFFSEQTALAIQDAVMEFQKLNIQVQDCRIHAERFSNQRFQNQFQNFVEAAWTEFQKPHPYV